MSSQPRCPRCRHFVSLDALARPGIRDIVTRAPLTHEEQHALAFARAGDREQA